MKVGDGDGDLGVGEAGVYEGWRALFLAGHVVAL